MGAESGMSKDENEDPSLAQNSDRDVGGGEETCARGLMTCGLAFYAREGA